MSANIRIEEIPHAKVGKQRIELVERKGLGHPDSLADGISEAVSRALCQKYRDVFGNIAHHNTDEVQIIGGESVPAFGGGEMVKPIYILLGGRATYEYGGEHVNVHGVAMEAARNFLDETVRNLDPPTDVILDSRMGKGSSDLTEMYARESKVPLANDTSFGIGHAPFTETEKTVLRLENYLNGEKFKRSMPAIGEDVKVMAYRDGDTITLTVAAAFVDRFVDDLDAYISLKEQLREEILSRAQQYTDKDIELHVNTADNYEKESVYLTVTGTSAEMGDDGSTGRGNRVSGLITPKRAMSLEASSGKNPVAHVGKIYNILSHYIADQIVAEQNGVEEATVKVLSQIGKPIDRPQVADIRVATSDGMSQSLRSEVEENVEYWLQHIPDVMEKVIEGEITTF